MDGLQLTSLPAHVLRRAFMKMNIKSLTRMSKTSKFGQEAVGILVPELDSVKAELKRRAIYHYQLGNHYEVDTVFLKGPEDIGKIKGFIWMLEETRKEHPILSDLLDRNISHFKQAIKFLEMLSD